MLYYYFLLKIYSVYKCSYCIFYGFTTELNYLLHQTVLYQDKRNRRNIIAFQLTKENFPTFQFKDAAWSASNCQNQYCKVLCQSAVPKLGQYLCVILCIGIVKFGTTSSPTLSKTLHQLASVKGILLVVDLGA